MTPISTSFRRTYLGISTPIVKNGDRLRESHVTTLNIFAFFGHGLQVWYNRRIRNLHQEVNAQ